MSMIDTKLQLKKETAALEQQQQNKKSLNQQSNRKFTNGESKGEQQKNPCLKHDGAHEYKDCPDHKNSKSKKAARAAKKRRLKRNFTQPRQTIQQSKNLYQFLLGPLPLYPPTSQCLKHFLFSKISILKYFFDSR
jgi:hypothetical protein